MRRDELEVGRVYLVAGRGEMRLAEFCPPPADLIRKFRAYGGRAPEGVTVRLESHGGGSYWVAPEEIVREATQEDLAARDAQDRPRGLACDDPECWCRRRGA